MNKGEDKSRWQFSLRRLLLLPVVVAVCMSIIVTTGPPSGRPVESSFWCAPIYLLSHSGGDRLIGVIACSGLGISIVFAVLWTNVYSLLFLAVALLAWLYLGVQISMAAAC
jgi:hypothetical protein